MVILVELSIVGRLGGAAPQDKLSGRLTRSLPNDPLPPRMLYEPLGGGTYPRGPAGGMTGPEVSGLWLGTDGIATDATGRGCEGTA